MGSRFFVEQIKCGITEGGMACGPVSGDVIVTIKYRKDEGPSQWISNAEGMGFATIYLNDFDPFEVLMSGDVENPKFGLGMTSEFEGLQFDDYEDMFEACSENKSNPAVPLLRYLVAVTRCSSDETKDLIALAEGRDIDEVEVPMSDIEEDYWDCKED